jgi:hypothetical protein
MKIILGSLFIVCALTVNCQAQTLEIPQDEFALTISSTDLEIAKGEAKSVEITILKSRGYRKSKARMGVSSNLPEGINVYFSPEGGVIERATALISVAKRTSPGTYFVILDSTIRYRKKGIVVKLTVL